MDQAIGRLSEGWRDASVPIRDGMLHWPDDPPVQIRYDQAIDRGELVNATALSMSAHTATHVDAPKHFLGSGVGVDRVPLSALMGLARLLEVRDPSGITVTEVADARPQPGERLIFRTRNSDQPWWEEDFNPAFVSLEPEAAQLLADRGIRTVGVDYLSVGGLQTGRETHLILLRAGICIIEGLALSGFEAGRYELICLPLRVADRDGAPARTLLRPLV